MSIDDNMRHTVVLWLTVAVLAVHFLSEPAVEPIPAGQMAFGVEAGAVPALIDRGVLPEYATVWVGAWNLQAGWQGTDAALRSLRESGVTPAIHFYYWGDDLDQHCLESGCFSDLHGLHKDGRGWQLLAAQLVQHLEHTMEGERVVIILETEFNKLTYEPLDGYLAGKAGWLRTQYPAAEIVLGLGNWYPQGWAMWDRAAAASDAIGLQGLRAMTRDGPDSYSDLVQDTLASARRLDRVFGKPLLLHDIGASSYPEPHALDAQLEVVQALFHQMDDLQRAGVVAVIYRSWYDTPDMDLRNHFGVAERHWGLAWPWGDPKPAGRAWLEGIAQERQAPSAALADGAGDAGRSAYAPRLGERALPAA